MASFASQDSETSIGPTPAVASRKARIAAIAVVLLLTLSVFALGFSALNEARNTGAAGTTTITQDGGDNAAVSAFKFVCPFH